MTPSKEGIKIVALHYCHAALWTEGKEDMEILEYQLKEIKTDCQNFIDAARKQNLLDNHESKTDATLEEQLGHDFWLTRNGHGAGFWDRPEVWGKVEAKKLTDLSEQFGEYYLDLPEKTL
ncbi:hypothetical protein KAR91_66805 [Candidatus Pacearchaeota archaeon]|nr:hypothetical protein [Candidatus Pacearchaeota archaeon]